MAFKYYLHVKNFQQKLEIFILQDCVQKYVQPQKKKEFRKEKFKISNDRNQ